MTLAAENQTAAVAPARGVGVSIEGVRHIFRGPVEAIGGIDLKIGGGEFVAILGPSGCGKSTLLRLIANLEKPTEGQVLVGEINSSFDRKTDVAYVFQDAHLLPWRTVLQNAVLPLELQGQSAEVQQTAARDALGLVGLRDFAERYPAELSGGMRMRVSIARALTMQPRLLLMDEPFAALDEITRQRLDELLRELWSKTGLTLIFVTHSTQEAVFLANRAVVMSARPGRVVLDHPIGLPAVRTGAMRADVAFAAHARALYAALEQGEQGSAQ